MNSVAMEYCRYRPWRKRAWPVSRATQCLATLLATHSTCNQHNLAGHILFCRPQPSCVWGPCDCTTQLDLCTCRAKLRCAFCANRALPMRCLLIGLRVPVPVPGGLRPCAGGPEGCWRRDSIPCEELSRAVAVAVHTDPAAE